MPCQSREAERPDSSHCSPRRFTDWSASAWPAPFFFGRFDRAAKALWASHSSWPLPFDTHPNNQPHVGCVFEVDFYGFDRGNFFAGVSFALHPPSGRAVLLVDNSVFIGGDRAGGGTDLDAEREYDLNLLVPRSGLHPKQGWHIKVTVVAPGVGGKLAKKTRVFWVRDCIDP